jgi:hypothetical protein
MPTLMPGMALEKTGNDLGKGFEQMEFFQGLH